MVIINVNMLSSTQLNNDTKFITKDNNPYKNSALSFENLLCLHIVASKWPKSQLMVVTRALLQKWAKTTRIFHFKDD